MKKGLTPGQFNIKNAMQRFEKMGDLFGGVLTNLQRIEEPLERLSELMQKQLTRRRFRAHAEAFHQGDAGEDDQHGDDFAPAKLFASKSASQETTRRSGLM